MLLHEIPKLLCFLYQVLKSRNKLMFFYTDRYVIFLRRYQRILLYHPFNKMAFLTMSMTNNSPIIPEPRKTDYEAIGPEFQIFSTFTMIFFAINMWYFIMTYCCIIITRIILIFVQTTWGWICVTFKVARIL